MVGYQVFFEHLRFHSTTKKGQNSSFLIKSQEWKDRNIITQIRQQMNEPVIWMKFYISFCFLTSNQKRPLQTMQQAKVIEEALGSYCSPPKWILLQEVTVSPLSCTVCLQTSKSKGGSSTTKKNNDSQNTTNILPNALK